MDRSTRNAIERATQRCRSLLEDDYAAQLEGTFDILCDGTIASAGGPHLTPRQRFQRDTIVAAIERKRATGMSAAAAVGDYLRDAAFTTLNRFVALKLLEARRLLQECVSRGEQSAGFVEFCGMAPGLALLPDANGYRLYLESLFDELSTEVKVLFDRRDPASVLWPRRQAFDALLESLNARELGTVWSEDETLGWVYQYFNGANERKRMREESQAPRNSRELAVRNQFFTPRYIVQFLTDNTLGRIWLEMHGEDSALAESLEYFVRPVNDPLPRRPRRDPRDLKVLDPACGSGHFLLYSYDLLARMYEEAWEAAERSPASTLTGKSLRADYPDRDVLRREIPALIIEHNLYGVEIDARCAQIAALALWLRAQRSYQELFLVATARPRIRRTHVVIAEPMPGDRDLASAFAVQLELPFLRTLFERMVAEMQLAAEIGTLLQVERSLAEDISRARRQYLAQQDRPELFPDLRPIHEQARLDLSGVTDDSVFQQAENTLLAALSGFAESAGGADVRRRIFADDAAQGVALIDLVRTRFDVVLMNPPFGDASLAAKSEFEKLYPQSKNDIGAAFVERGIHLLHSRGMLGAITSRSGFFLSSLQRWREEIILAEAPPLVFADLGSGVMDAAMVEAAAYSLIKVT
jgi:hypothetical protein